MCWIEGILYQAYLLANVDIQCFAMNKIADFYSKNKSTRKCFDFKNS